MTPVHKSHKMSKVTSEIIAPCGTPRFYAYRQCENCGAEQYEHPAGKFIDAELNKECTALAEEE
jgi:hypothetical protein